MSAQVRDLRLGRSVGRIGRWVQSLDRLGLTLALLFFAVSLTPSLLPRAAPLQGALAGLCGVVGYGIGSLNHALANRLGARRLNPRMVAAIGNVVVAGALIIAMVWLWRVPTWQNATRAAMGMPPLTGLYRFETLLAAIIAAALLSTLFALIRRLARRLVRWSSRWMPPRIAYAVGVTLTVLLIWVLANDVALRATFHLLDNSFREFDALMEPERPQPMAPTKTGSAQSLIRWETLGRAGREFVASGPDRAEIMRLTGRAAREPIRVYVGLRGGDTPEARALLALEELKRQGAFERPVLIIVTPTGTGWVDPAAMDTVEFLHAGNVASVAVQYSYLSSPLTLLFDPDYGADSARTVFRVIHDYWASLPAASRPRLYVHGLSLGAMNSEQSIVSPATSQAPIDGALWSGPPFTARTWRAVTEARNAGSPQWLPVLGDSRRIRFANQQGFAVPMSEPWGTTRTVYIQYASDAITFFDYRDVWRAPAWLAPPRGPDVSPALSWYPLVTAAQLAVDLMTATSAPVGFGHLFAAEHYVDPWVATTDVHDWSPAELESLKRALAARQRQAEGDSSGYASRGG